MKQILEKARSALAAHDYGLVESLTRRITEGTASPHDAELTSIRATALSRNGRTSDAQALLERALRKDGALSPSAAELSLLLAEILCEQSLFKQAIAVLERIAAAWAPPAVARRMEILRGHAISGLGDQDAARRLLAQVAEACREAGDREALAEACTRAALVEYRRGNIAGAEELAGRALETLGEGSSPTAALGRAHRYLAIFSNVQCRFQEAIEHHVKELDVFSRMRFSRARCRAFLSLAMTYLGMGELELADLYLRKGLALAEEEQDQTSLSVAYSRLGILELFRGRVDEACYCFKKDLALARKAETPHNAAFPLRNIGRALRLLGRAREALAPLDESMEIFRKMGDTANVALSTMERALCESEAETRPPAAAIEHLGEARALLEKLGRPQLVAQVDTAEATVRARAGETEKAEECFARGVDAWLKHEALTRSVEAYLSFGAALAGSGKRDLALRYLQRGLDVARQTGQVEACRLFLARIDSLSDRPVVARVRTRAAGEDAAAREVSAGPVTRESIAAESRAMREVIELAAKVAASDMPVLIFGETGTGKELLARFIHWESPRRERPLVTVNCGAIPRELVESELFGHVRGAFTGAVADKQGSFEIADAGTLFLDEVGELPRESQVKLLRVLQSGEINRVGDPRPRRVNVRVMAATNRPLGESVSRGEFRDDLYYRLNVFPIHIPPLRERPEDIPALVESFLGGERMFRERGVRTVSRAAMAVLRKYRWPGNARELLNVLQRAAILCKGGSILARDLPGTLGPAASGLEAERFKTLAEVTDEHIGSALALARGNRSRAAKLLGVHRNTLLKRLSRIAHPALRE